MNVLITDTQTDVTLNGSALVSLVKGALAVLEVTCREISFEFCSSDRIRELHAEFFNDPTTTDCITFPIDPPGEDSFLGEVFVCPHTAIQYCSDNGGSVSREISLYVLHGILHLLGYDDIEESDRQVMRAKEHLLMNHPTLTPFIESSTVK